MVIHLNVNPVSADSYWLSPRLVNKLEGERRVDEQMSLGYLLGLSRQVQSEVTSFLKFEGEIPSLGISAQIQFSKRSDQASFLEELQEAVVISPLSRWEKSHYCYY